MNKTITHSTIFKILESWAPLDLAYDWDNVGLQVGAAYDSTKKVMITLDVLESVVDEAIAEGVNLIVAHHPLLFKPLKQIKFNTPIGRTLQKLIKHNITVYAMHTNLDIAPGGVNDILCEELGIKKTGHLLDVQHEKLYKLVVYVPMSHMEVVRDALSEAGAGHIGNYSHCTFQTKGQGTFKPLDGTNPYIGSRNVVEYVEEIKLETIVKENELTTAINQMIKVHPYEEVAYDMIPLMNKGNTHGIGRVGLLHEQLSLGKLAEHVKATFDCSHVRVIGDLTENVQVVAILGGSGEKYMMQAKKMGADVYITGDMTFHTAQYAEESGLLVIDAGHYIEKVMKQAVKTRLENVCKAKYPEIIISKVNTDPFQFI